MWDTVRCTRSPAPLGVAHAPLLPAQRGAATRYLTPPAGQVVRIKGWESVISDPPVLHAEILVQPGQHVPPLSASADRCGVVVVGANGLQEAREAAARQVTSVEFEVEETQ